MEITFEKDGQRISMDLPDAECGYAYLVHEDGSKVDFYSDLERLSPHVRERVERISKTLQAALSKASESLHELFRAEFGETQKPFSGVAVGR